MSNEDRIKALFNATSDTLAAVDAALAGQTEPERPASLRLLRPGEAAKALNVSRCTLWRMTREKRVRCVELRRGAIRYPESELARLVEGRA
jgi:excisionase family DNA binding protein